jgi:Ferredoxin-like domain in Api92-like protein
MERLLPENVEHDGSLHVQFDTAWSFPWPVMEKIVADFPSLVFDGSAVEPNMEFYIEFHGIDGEIFDEDKSEEYFANEHEDSDLLKEGVEDPVSAAENHLVTQQTRTGDEIRQIIDEIKAGLAETQS